VADWLHTFRANALRPGHCASFVIVIDEQGTTAAAATGTSVGLVLALPGQPFSVDRPFLFFIRHNSTGAILFQGRVVDPSL
jgi:serpin B